MTSGLRVVFVGAVTAYLLSRMTVGILSGTSGVAEQLLDAAMAALGLEYAIAVWPAMWHGRSGGRA